MYNWWTSGEGGTDIGRGKKIYNNLYEISKDNSGIVNLYPHWMGYTTAFNYSDTAPSNTAGQTITINNNINDGIDNNLYQIYGNCFFYKGTDGEYHDYEGANPDLKVTASIPDNNGYKYIFNGWHHKNWNYLTDGLGKLTYKNNYDIGKGKASYVLSPHFSRVGISYDVRLNANVPENTESTLQVLHRNGISSYIYDSNSRYFSRELTYDDLQDMLSPDVYSLKGYHLVSRSNWYTEKTGGNTVSAPCNNTKTEYPDWTEKNWNLTTTDGATVDLYARWQANNYKIAYNLDGGTYGTSHPTSADYDTMVAIDNPSKAGYTFTGWTIMGYDSTTSGHNAATWTGETGTSYKNLTATDGATVTFTATWSKEAPKTARYTVKHYQMNTDGTYPSTPTNMESFSGLIGSNVTPAVKDYGQIFDKPSTKTVIISANGNTTVEYKYPRKKARVIVGKSTGIKTTDPVPGDYADGYIGQTVTLSATPETGYRFKNWTSLLKENYGTVFSTTAGFNYTLTYNDSRAVQHQYGNGTSTMWGAYMQANAEPITYNIKYNYNGGIKGAFAPTSAKYNEDVKISNPTKKNCIFAGWTITGYDPNTSGHSSATWTDETSASFKNLASVEGKTVTFTATWVQKDVHLATISGRGIKLSKPVQYDGYVGETKRVTAELKPGYRFVNWTNYYNANEVISTDKDFDYKLTDKDYDNYLSDKGGTYLKSNAVPIDYTITYELNGGTASNPVSYNVESNTFTLNNPTRAGYTFAGWTGTDITGTSKIVTINQGSIGNRTYTATWTSINYTISYDLNGGAVAVNNPTSYNIETPTFTLNNPTKTGYIFEGWCESKDTSYVYNRNANEVIKKDESDSTSYFIPECYASLDYALVFDPAYYLAKYPDLKSVCGDDVNKALSHFVNYGMKEGRQGSAEFEVNAYKAKYKDLSDAFGDNLPRYYVHYILAGKSEGRTISQASISIYQGSIGNRTYTATWTPIEYSIVYTKGYTNNAKDDVIQSGIKYNKDVTLISNPFTGRSYTVKYSTSTTDRDWDKVTAPAGFNGTLEFAHWNILSKTYAAGTKLKNLTTKNGDKITATAQWKDKKFTLPVVSRPGYVFAGWYSMVDRKVYKANTEYTISQALTAYDNTFTAQWTAKTDTPYKVEHYKMNLDGTTYTLADTDNFKGTTDTSVTPAIKTYEGFTSPSTQTVTIKGDGTTVVKYYYTRNKYTLDLNGLINGTLRGNLVDVVKNPITGAEDRHTAGTAVVTVNGTVVGNKVTDYCNEVYYGSSISIITTAESGYNIIDNSNVNFKMPAEGKTVTVTINAKDTKYLVRHWKKNVNTDSKTYNENSLNDSNYTMYDAEYLSGKAYSWVKPVVRTLEGFTYKGVLPSEGTAYVKPDGTTVIDVYYTRNTYTINGGNVNANVEYGNGISSVSGLKTYEYEQKVTLTANLKVGYHWHGTDKCASSGKYPTGWYSRNNSGVDGILTDNTTYNSQTIKFNMPARNVYLGVKATNNSYTVVYNKNQPVEPKSISNVTGSTESQTFIYDESQNLRNNGFTLTGYTRKSGWMTKPSKNGNGTADFSYGQSVKNLTTVNLGTVNLYAIWEDNAPEEINISSTNNFAATQTVTLTARDYGSGINYISFGKDEKYEKVTCNADGSVTFTRKVNASGTYIFSVKDKNGKVSKKTITFYQTTLNTNKNNIVSSDGKNVIESDFTSVPETLSTYISINEAGKSITPVTKRDGVDFKRDGVDFLGWSTDRKGKTGIISIKADGNKTCYAIWKDTKKPVAVLEDVTSNLSASQTITFKLYDTAEGKTNTGSDIAGYYIGTNPDAKSNTKKNVTADKNGTYSGSETITLNGETTYYIFPYDKAGNIGDTIKLKSTGNNNTPEITPGILFHRVDFNANGSTDSPATVNIPYAVIPHGSTITMPTAYRLGYHDYTGSDEQTADNDGKTSYWGTDSKAVTGFNTLKVTKSQTCFALWKANKYTITLVSNKPDTKNGYRVNSTYSPENDTKITVTFDEVIPFSKAKNPEITGWTFKGYAFNELSTSDNNNSKTVVSTNQKFGLQFVKDWYKDAGKTFENVSDITLYAAWSENRYTVNYNTTGGTALKLNRITYWYEDEFSLPDATGDYYNTFMKLEDNKKAVTTYRPAHHFVMWKCVSDENSNGDVYSSGGKAVRLVSKNNGECTLNAVWKQKQIVTLNITSDTFKESMTNDYAALADAMWAEKGTGYIKDQTAIKEYTFTKTSDIKETK